MPSCHDELEENIDRNVRAALISRVKSVVSGIDLTGNIDNHKDYRTCGSESLKTHTELRQEESESGERKQHDKK